MQRYKKEYLRAEKKLYKEMIFDRLAAKNKNVEKDEEQKTEEDAFADMPDLE